MGREGFVPLLLFLVAAAVGAATAKSGDAAAIADLVKSLSLDGVGGGNACDVTGIKCDGSGQATGINLANKGLSGTLPASLSSLTALQSLQLQGNALTGAVPSLAGMGSLSDLALDGNQFSSLPNDFLQGLTSLTSLSMDDIPSFKAWEIPDAVANCGMLQNFSASNASIVGAFPAFLANLTSLRLLRLSYNNLTGALPAQLSGLDALETLQLNNQISDGKLSGPIDVLATVKSLKVLWLQSNAFTGPIPDFSDSQLVDFNVRDNQLTGVVPASLMRITTLQRVALSNNHLQGPKPNFTDHVSTKDIDAGNGYCLTDPVPCNPLTMILLEVASGFGYPVNLAQTWVGNDPCGTNWFGVSCNSGNVVSIALNNKNLSGKISPAFANLTKLERLSLANNNLSGVIPDALTTLRKLKYLDVSKNSLTGQVPVFNTSVKVITTGNRFGESSGDNGNEGSSNSRSLPSNSGSAQKLKSDAGMIIGILLAVVLLVVCTGLFLHHRSKSNVDKFSPVSTKNPSGESDMMKIQVVGTNGSSNGSFAVPTEHYSHVNSDSTNIANLFESHGMQLPINVVLNATNNFDEDFILGRGGFGVVYKGTLNGKLVAVKRCDSGTMGTKGLQEFMAEIDVLRKVRHRHLVALLGYCTNGNERLLVYEYMSGGTLREHLCDLQQSGYTPLTWTQRITIALDVARGIEYLHGLAQETFIHRDLKPSNILLDQDLRAKVSDFGLAKLAKDTDKSMMTRVAGTFGYLAPEYATTGKITTKVDVYAYGVILMEMITGRKVLDDSLPEDETHLVTIFRRNLLDKEKFRKFVDPTLELNAEAWNSLLEVADLGRHCTAREPQQRPDMCHCVNRLSSLVDNWKPSDIVDDDDRGTSEMGLHQQLEKWRCDDFTISDSDSLSTFSLSRNYH